MAEADTELDEDVGLKRQLELYVKRIQDPDPSLQKVALDCIRQEIRASLNSMTFPKPQLLRPHYRTLKAYFETMAQGSNLKKQLADILSVLAHTMSAKGESLKYRLLGSKDDVGCWGHEYVRNLNLEILHEPAKPQNKLDLMELAQDIVAFYMQNNAELEAVDLLMEVEQLDTLPAHVNQTNFKRTCLYLISSARYLHGPEEKFALAVAYKIYLKFEEYVRALQIALFLDNLDDLLDIFTLCDNPFQKRQFCYILARHGYPFVLYEKLVSDDVNEAELQQSIVNNVYLSEGYIDVALDFGIMKPKSLEEIYMQEYLPDGSARASAAMIDPALQNLAAFFVNALVNAGFGQGDKTIASPGSSSGSSALTSSLEEHGKTSAVASLGMILMWDFAYGLPHVLDAFDENDNHVMAGALLGVGILNSSIKNDREPALDLINYLDSNDASIRIGATIGLGISYACTQNDEVLYRMVPILHDAEAPLDVVAFTAISLGLICVSSCHEEVAKEIIGALICRSELDLKEPITRLFSLGLGLVYLGKQDEVNGTAEKSRMFNEKIRQHCDVTLLSCAYAGTGNVLKVQHLLGQCLNHLEEGETHQGPAVLGIAMVAIAEEVGLEMSIRSLEHLLQYGERSIRRAVPLALGLLCISNPQVNVMNTLSKLSHDTDPELAMAAVISLGLIGAGTSNARIAGMLHKLSRFYCRDASLMFCVRLAQGLVHLGKGLLTLNPFHSDRFLLSPIALAGLTIVLHACLDMRDVILGKYSYVLHYLVLAMQPRMLLTVDCNLDLLPVPVRVGKAVDVVGRPGNPKIITGFQTHDTPVILGAGERAELATDKYIPLSPFLEGFVILKENPDYREA